MRVVTRHAAQLVITLDKALALREAIRLKTVRCLLGQLVELGDCGRRPVAFPTRVINDLAALVGELIQQQPAGLVPSRHRLSMCRTRAMTGLTPNTEKAWLRNQAGVGARDGVTPNTVHRIIHTVRLTNRLVGKVFLPRCYAKAFIAWKPGLANLNTPTWMNREKGHPCLATTQNQIDGNRDGLAGVFVRRLDNELALVIRHLAAIWDWTFRWCKGAKDIREALVQRLHMPRPMMLLKFALVAGLTGIIANIAIRCRCGSQLFLTPRAGWCTAFVDARGAGRNRQHNGR